MPAEWEPHEATWVTWPHNTTDWPGKFAPIPWVYADIIRRLSRSENVRILNRNADEQERAIRMLNKAGANTAMVEFHRAGTNRSWTRDYAPVFLVRGNRECQSSDGQSQLALTKWKFNGWAKYADHILDNKAGEVIARFAACPVWKPAGGAPIKRAVLEAGSFDVNGQGLLITTEECLLSKVQQRNPGFSRHDIEGLFAGHLGIKKVIWLRQGIAGDDTHDHVDDLARFTDASTIVLALEDDPSEINYEPLRENLALLKQARDLQGQPLRIVTLPMPQPVVFEGQRLPASYANFYIANGMVLVPTFNDPNDRIALQILSELFPNRKVTGIHCLDLVLGLGTLHCMTMQQPAITIAKSNTGNLNRNRHR
ncbi:MAG: agmatine deiminase family protein [Candidatus Sumerlaeota bacterium]|nr:agmatine deiminase family protein [Candidatus Sumerlaeota bacterium]